MVALNRGTLIASRAFDLKTHIPKTALSIKYVTKFFLLLICLCNISVTIKKNGITDACSTTDCLVNLVERMKRQRMKRQKMKRHQAVTK